MIFELIQDFQKALAVMPREGLPTLGEEQRERDERAARWTAEIIAYANAWNDRRDRQTRGEVVTEPEPVLPEVIPSCRMWKDEEIAADRRPVIHTTRFDQVQAYDAFFESECYPLLNFGSRPGFLAQHAANRIPGDPVRKPGLELLTFG